MPARWSLGLGSGARGLGWWRAARVNHHLAPAGIRHQEHPRGTQRLGPLRFRGGGGPSYPHQPRDTAALARGKNSKQMHNTAAGTRMDGSSVFFKCQKNVKAVRGRTPRVGARVPPPRLRRAPSTEIIFCSSLRNKKAGPFGAAAL